MSTPITAGRNEPCPCGSGKKYKACCALKVVAPPEVRRTAPWRAIGLGLAGVVVAGGIVMQLAGSEPAPSEPAPGARTPTPPLTALPANFNPLAQQPVTPGALTPQPPGPAPAGKVWSADHGHWHDAPGAATASPIVTGADGATIPVLPPSSPGTPTPQPPGPAPAGKVWSAEHGHWHDDPAAAPVAIPGGG